MQAPRQCPSDNIAAYTTILIEGTGETDPADGYLTVQAHAVTDLFPLNDVRIVPRHHEATFNSAISLTQFPPVPIPGFGQLYTLSTTPLPATPSPSPDVKCTYLDGDGTYKDVFGDENLAFRLLINNIRGMIMGLDGLQRNADGVWGVEGIYRNDRSVTKIVAQWSDKSGADLGLKPDVRGAFIGGVGVEVYYDYAPFWFDDGARNGTLYIKPGAGSWESINQAAPQAERRTFNPAAQAPVRTSVEGYLNVSDGGKSGPREKPYRVTPQLRLFDPSQEVQPAKVGEEVAYKFERAMPKKAWEGEFTFSSLAPPPLRSKTASAKAQAKILFEASSLQPPITLKPGFGGEGELEVKRQGGPSYAGKLAVEGNAEILYTEGGGIELKSGNGKVDFQIGIKETYTPFDLVPQLKLAVAGTAVEAWLERNLSVEAGLYAFAVGSVNVFQDAGGMNWKAQVQPGVRVTAKGVAGNEEAKFGAEVEAKGEGRLNFFINDPANPFFGGADGEVSFTASVVAFNFKFSYEKKYPFSITRVMGAGDTIALPLASQPVAPDYQGGEVWLGDAPATQPKAQSGLTSPRLVPVSQPDLAIRLEPREASAITTTVLVSRAYPYAAPAMDPTGKAICWVTQRQGLPASRNTEIACATGNTPSFGTPVTITNDTFADTLPSVALAAPSTPVVTWWRYDDPAAPVTVTFGTTFLQRGEVMASVGSVTGTWTAPITLGTPGTLDYSPVAAGNGVDRALVVWRANPAGQLAGFGATPDAVKAAIYNATSKTWSAPQVLTTTPGLVDVDVAYGASEAATVYAIDADRVATTTADTEVWAQRFISNTWQPAIRLTNNSVEDTSPRIAFDAAGQPVIVWVQIAPSGERALAMKRGWAGQTVTATMTGDNAPGELRRLSVNANGDVAVVWHSVSLSETLQSDSSYALYDAATGVWSAPIQITGDADDDRYTNVAWRGNDQIHLFYDRATLQELTSTVVISGVTTPFTYTTRDPNGHALVIAARDVLTGPGTLLLHLPQADAGRQSVNAPASPAGLSVAGTMSVSPTNVAPGSPASITVMVRNTADRPAQNVRVAFGVSDARIPQGSAPVTPIVTVTVPLLRGGESRPVVVNWTAPAPKRPNRLIATASCAVCGQAQAVITTTLPDLAVGLTGIDRNILPGIPFVRATISNTGVLSAAGALVTVYDATGPLGSANANISATLGLTPGHSADAYVELDGFAAFTGSHPLTVSVQLISPTTAIGEASTDNNQFAFDWVRLPDWSLLSGGIVLGPGSAAGTPFTITAYNEADVTAPATGIALYTDAPQDGGTLLWQGTLSQTLAFDKVKISGRLTGNVPRIYVRANPAGAVSELTVDNNNARAGTGFAQWRIRLPIVRR